MSVRIQIKNLPELRRAFDMAPRLMNTELQKALTKSAITVQRESMIESPVLTGRLRSSHTFNVSGNSLSMRAEIGPTVDYAGFVHEGTRFQRANPFLKRAAEGSLNKIEMFFTEAVGNVFDKIARMV